MREIEVRVVSLEEADDHPAEFWPGGRAGLPLPAPNRHHQRGGLFASHRRP